jgi:uncharacterized protein
MIKAGDLPDTISIFPLSGALLLPRTAAAAHLRAALPADAGGRAEDAGAAGGHGPAQRGTRAQRHRLHAIGCVGRVTQFSETEDGRYLITLTGIIAVPRAVRGGVVRALPRCHVSWEGFGRDLASTEGRSGLRPGRLHDAAGPVLRRALLSADWETLREAEDELLINSLSMMLPFEPEDKQALLEAPSLYTRRETLVTLIEYSLRGGENDEVMQ